MYPRLLAYASERVIETHGASPAHVVEDAVELAESPRPANDPPPRAWAGEDAGNGGDTMAAPSASDTQTRTPQGAASAVQL